MSENANKPSLGEAMRLLTQAGLLKEGVEADAATLITHLMKGRSDQVQLLLEKLGEKRVPESLFTMECDKEKLWRSFWHSKGMFTHMINFLQSVDYINNKLLNTHYRVLYERMNMPMPIGIEGHEEEMSEADARQLHLLTLENYGLIIACAAECEQCHVGEKQKMFDNDLAHYGNEASLGIALLMSVMRSDKTSN